MVITTHKPFRLRSSSEVHILMYFISIYYHSLNYHKLFHKQLFCNCVLLGTNEIKLNFVVRYN